MLKVRKNLIVHLAEELEREGMYCGNVFLSYNIDNEWCFFTHIYSRDLRLSIIQDMAQMGYIDDLKEFIKDGLRYEIEDVES